MNTMNFLKKLALVASLALASLGSAQAAGTYIQMDSGDPADFQNSWTIDSSVLGNNGVKNDTFFDFYQFNVPDDEYVSFSLFGSKVTFHAPDDSLGFVLLGLGGSPFLIDSKGGTTAHSIEGGEYFLTSGMYQLDVFGKYTATNGTYEVDIFGTPVPEPSGWALLVAGLGVTVLMARRRKQQA